MVKVMGLFIISLIVFQYEFRNIKKLKSKKDNRIYTITFVFTFIILAMFSLDVQFPYPFDWIKDIYQPIVEPYNELLRKNQVE